jgi:type IV pilus assembly protein PilB
MKDKKKEEPIVSLDKGQPVSGKKADADGKLGDFKARLGDMLVEKGLLKEDDLKKALAEQKVTGQRLGELLVERGVITSEEINYALASQMGTEAVNIFKYIIEPQILNLVNEADARQFKTMPLFKSGDTLYVATINPNNIVAIDHLQKQSGYKVKTLLANEADVSWAIEQYYKTSGTVEEIISSLDPEKLVKGDKDQEQNVVKLVDLLINDAVHKKASDIHIEPEEKVMNVRHRIDGILHKAHVLPKAIQAAVISRIKILSNLDISEKRLPQDGRLQMKIEAKAIDFRVSTCVTVYGENIVLRVLDKSGLVVGLESLGFGKKEYASFQKMITAPYGIILVTGPTGSGKTTTLYSALQILNKEDVNIMTVEDPVEFQFHGIRQVQVNHKIGLNFVDVLRSFLRQDPDIVMVGEIRDLETAEIAVQAALTGHLVFSTLHTNDAATAFTRLTEMGIEPFLVSSSLLGVLAQRLVRKICSKCKEEYTPSAETVKSLGLEGKDQANRKFARGKGCDACGHTGYKGRIGIYELLLNSAKIQDLVLKRSPVDQIQKVAQEEGSSLLRDVAIEKAFSGATSLDEVFRITQGTII